MVVLIAATAPRPRAWQLLLCHWCTTKNTVKWCCCTLVTVNSPCVPRPCARYDERLAGCGVTALLPHSAAGMSRCACGCGSPQVVCSPDVMTIARSQLKEHGDCAGGLLAAVASDKCSSTTFACLVTSHVCLSLFVQHAQQQQQKSCQPAQPMVAHEAADMLGRCVVRQAKPPH